MATRGMSGGMSEMVQKQLANQGAANRQAQMDMDLNAQAQQRALSALMSGAQLGGNMQSNDFNQSAQKAQASDAISRFNAANQQNVIGNNVNAKNNAQQWNATNAQSNANQNVGVKNNAQQYNLGLNQQKFNNSMAKATGQNAVGNQMANNSYNSAKDQDAFIGGVASSVAKYGASQDPNKKKQVVE
jgi:hypothetical protein